MKNKYYILCAKNCLLKIMGDVTVGIFESSSCYFFLVEHSSIFGVGYYKRKNNIFPFTDVLSFIPFLKESWEKNFWTS